MASTRLQREPSLFKAARAGKADLVAAFGGQGSNNFNCLEELVQLNQQQGNFVGNLLQRSSYTLNQLATSPQARGYYDERGFDLAAWLLAPDSAPDQATLALAPISFPLNTLISLANYCILCRRLQSTPGQVRSALKAVVGHSQGLFAATAVASSDSWDDFYRAADLTLQTAFFVGLESHLACPATRITAVQQRESIDHDNGEPSPMLSVSGIPEAHLSEIIGKVNKQLSLSAQRDGTVFLALRNARDKHIIAGSAHALLAVCTHINRLKAPEGSDQSRVLFSKRKPNVDVRFLPISAPFHSPYLEAVEPLVMTAVPTAALRSNELHVPLLHPGTGENFQELRSENLIPAIVRAVTVDPVAWQTVCDRLDATHMLDFGPGRIGELTHTSTEGTGLYIINMTNRAPSTSGIGHQAEFYSGEVPLEPQSWQSEFAPGLVYDESGSLRLQTRMTMLYGTPPLMVPGMVPTTVKPDFVAALMQGGHHAELAGGGYSREADFERAVRKLASSVPPHRGVTCNLIWASPRTIAWQTATLRRLSQEGIPISGLTIGAGVPSPDIVAEYIETMGLSYMAFKPGSVPAIDQVIEIAKQHPGFPMGLQWTGGRAGGHHSFEDFHHPIVARYGRIRECRNLVLIAGSGFGGAEDSLPYLTGDWSIPFGCAPMPFDGVLFGSRMMVSTEAHTSEEAKDIIVEAQGTSDKDWWRSYQEPSGGVVTVMSEMGQPIHLLATRGVMLWKELDEKVFSIGNSEKRVQYLREHHDEIVSRLNRDFAKPWFAVNARGDAVELDDLTYQEVMQRLSCLLFLQDQSRWIDSSYYDVAKDFFSMSAERFHLPFEGFPTEAESNPKIIMDAFETHLGHNAQELLYPEDVCHLIARFRRRGGKPVPFIPKLDEHFETWFKKDSLWQSENIDAVPDRDVQRVCIIQGPVAARHSVCATQSATTILDSIVQDWISALSSRNQAVQHHRTSDMHTGSAIDFEDFPGLQTSQTGTAMRYKFSKKGAVPKTELLFEHIAGQTAWLQAALLESRTFAGYSWRSNSIRAAFTPSPGDVLEVVGREGSPPQAMRLLSNSMNRSLPRRAVVEIASEDGKTVRLSLSPQALGHSLPSVHFTYVVQHDGAGCRLYERDEDRQQQIKDLYHRLWIDEESQPFHHAGLNSEYSGNEMVLTEQAVRHFEDVVRRASPSNITSWAADMPIPLDYCVVIAWSALVKPLILGEIDCDLSRLLHQSVDITYNEAAECLRVGDQVHSVSRINGLTTASNGKQIEISADILRASEAVVNIKTHFFIRESSSTELRSFKSVQEPEMVLEIDSEIREALLLSRNWLIFNQHPTSLRGSTVLFQLTSHTTYGRGSDINSIQVTGQVSRVQRSGQLDHIGRVYLEEDGSAGNVIVDFLHRHGSPRTHRQSLQQPGWPSDLTSSFKAPARSASYATISKDRNPIHLCPTFARFAGLSGTVVHGMHTSAIAKRLVEFAVGDVSKCRFRRWRVDFQDVVLPNDPLRVEFQHTAMEKGRMILEVQVFNENTNDKVIDAEASVEQTSTGYVFCGQGSQEKGMGMELYKTEASVRSLWDRGDNFLRERYGFSLLQIVRENPKRLTISFHGKRGRRIRDNYLAMTKKHGSLHGEGVETCIVPSLTKGSTSHTFASEKGLLFSTQFSQPALALMEMAEYEHLKANGVVQAESPFAGHSLGEYAALGACTSFMQLENLLELVFYRGLKMQHALERDSEERTDYSMVAVDPSRVHKAFNERGLQHVVELIGNQTTLLLEVVNYNVASQQYVCAGHFRCLFILGKVLDELASIREPTLPSAAQLLEIIKAKSIAAQYLTNDVTLERGKASIPLSGIDIPFHSSMLRNEIEHYRSHLSKKIEVDDIRLNELVGRWIPNVTGTPFSIDRTYVEHVQKITESEPLRHLLSLMA